MKHGELHAVGILPVEVLARFAYKRRVHQAGCKCLLLRDQQSLIQALLFGRVKRQIGRQHLSRENHREKERIIENGIPEGQSAQGSQVIQVIG
ncbi:hypothetical protein SDC9_167794 [bioreactor metagenome]|uniref:Uncharacterized protein n=1 Tax=bioreactor metagenome TaxID=1076179 RepID=A0A645G193_9ZZZZ